MSIVTLASGGLDSTVMAVLIKESNLKQMPLFVDYGQINKEAEFSACRKNFARHQLPEPEIADLSGYGALLPSGITSHSLNIVEDAFLPGRNLLLLLVAASYAYQRSARSVAIGLLDERYSIFPDQTRKFLDESEDLLSAALGTAIKIISPLITFSKKEIVAIAKEKGVSQTYSCHAGSEEPCGKCIACREYQ